MDSPIKKFIEWYISLPVPHRESIAEFVIFFNIGFDDLDTTNNGELHDEFIRKLKEYSNDNLKGTGLDLMLRANVNFLMSRFGTKNGSEKK
jgi:hypothetical protein